VNDVWKIARLLIERHGSDAAAVAESQAIEELVCGDADESATWEQVAAAVEALLSPPPAAFAAPAMMCYLH
jgi:hypothetical protein